MRERMRVCPLCGYPMDACDYSPIYGYSWFHPKSETSALCKYSEKLIWEAHLEKSSTGGINDIPRNN
jgi:hypothetical protein